MSSGKPETGVSYLFGPLMATPERYFPMMLEKTLEEPSKIYDLTYGFLGTEVGSLNVEPWKWVMLGDRLLQKWSPRRSYRVPILEQLASLNSAQIVPTLEWLCCSRREPLTNRLRAAELLLPFNGELALQTLGYWCHRPDVQAILVQYEPKRQLFGKLLQIFSTAASHKDRPWVYDWPLQVEILQGLVGERLEPWCMEAMESAIERFRFPTDISKRYFDSQVAFTTIKWLGCLQSESLVQKYREILRGDRDDEDKYRSHFSYYVLQACGQYPLPQIEGLLRSIVLGQSKLDYAGFNSAIGIIQQRHWGEIFKTELLEAGFYCLSLPKTAPLLPGDCVLEALVGVNPEGFFDLLQQSLHSRDSRMITKAIHCLIELYPQLSVPALLDFLRGALNWLGRIWPMFDEPDQLWERYAEGRLDDWDVPILKHLATVDDPSVAIALQSYLANLNPERHLAQRRPFNARDFERNKRMLIYELLNYFCQRPSPEFTPYFVSLLPNLEELMAGLAEEQAEEFEQFGVEVFERMVMLRERLLEKLVEMLGGSEDARAIEPLQNLKVQAQRVGLLPLAETIQHSLVKLQS